MKADAKPSAEKEALEWATGFFRDDAAKLKLKRDAAGRLWHNSRAKNIVALYDHGTQHHPERMTELLTLWSAQARNGGPALELCALSAALIERGDTLPPPLQGFVVEFLRDPRPDKKRTPGPDRDDLWFRNAKVFFATREIVKRWGFPATRSPATKDSAKHPSGASIVRQALEVGSGVHLTEAAVNKIWTEKKRRQRRPSRPLFGRKKK